MTQPSRGDVVWTVDDRPPTVWTRAYVAGMWLLRDKAAFEGESRTRRTAEAQQRKGDRAPTRWTRLMCRVLTSTGEGLTVWSLRPRRARPRARVLYLHGGGYVHPLTVDYWRLARSLVHSGNEVVVPAYPLAPGATVDDVLPSLLELARRVTADPVPTVFMGDSAGGALSLVLAQRLRDEQHRGPVGVVTLCPWLDATLDEDAVAGLEAADPMLAESGLRAAGRWWAGRRAPTDPVVSPVEGDLDDLPPVDVLIGDHDILRPAVDDLVDVLRGTSTALRVHEVPAMFHVWMTRAIPEGRRTRRLLARIVAERAAQGRQGQPSRSSE